MDNETVEVINDDFSVGVYVSIKKNVKEYIGVPRLKDKNLPLVLFGISTDDVRKKAETFYRDEIFNKIHSFQFIDPISDDMEAQKTMISGFEIREDRNEVDTPDKRSEARKWMHHKGLKKRVRCLLGDVAKLVSEGYEEGRDFEPMKLSKPKDPNWVNPNKDRIWMNNGKVRIRVTEEDVTTKLREGTGWMIGKGTFTDTVPDSTIVIPIPERPAPDFE